MAKKPTLTDITAGFASNTVYNDNNAEIETAFDNTLSRDGSAPNQMEADIDLNGKDLLNVGSINGSTDFATTVARGTIEEYVPFTRAEVESRSIDSSVDAIRTAGYTNPGDGGGAVYKRVESEPTHNLKVQSNDGQWWELVYDQGGLNPYQAGAVGDDVTDDSQAFLDLLGYARIVTLQNGGALPRILINGNFYLGTTTLQLKSTVHLLGLGGGQSGILGSSLRWDANTTGIIVHRHDTLGATTESPSTGQADGSIIEGLELVADEGTIAGITDDTKGHGIWLRARAVVHNVTIKNFPGNGIHIVADQFSGGATEGNANGWRVEGARIIDCHQSGLFTDRADANAGTAISVDASSNGRWGIHDSSFLGNTYTGCHTAGNGGFGVGENGGTKGSIVHFNGVSYQANANATEADYVATQPGTDESVWIDMGAGTSGLEWQAGQPEGTYFAGGSYRTDSSAARNVFLGCYNEGFANQGDPQLVLPTQTFGGFKMLAKGLGNTAGQILADAQGSNLRGEWVLSNHLNQTPDRDLTMRINGGDNRLLSFETEGEAATIGWRLEWDESLGNYQLLRGSKEMMRITTSLSTPTYGRSSAVDTGEIVFPEGVWIGVLGAARHRTTGSAAPTTGAWAQGDLVWNHSPVAGSPYGWVCVSGGSPGTWAEIRGVGTQTAGADQAALTNSTGGTRDGTLSAVSDTTASDQSAVINDNLTELHTLLDEMRTTLVNFGLMKGAA